MSYRRFQTYFFLALLVGSGVLTLAVFRSYLTLLAFGGVFAIASRPLYKRLHKSLRSETASAFLTVVIVATLLILPLVLFFAELTVELATFFKSFTGFDYGAIDGWLKKVLPAEAHNQVPALIDEGSKLIGTLAQNMSVYLVSFFQNLFSTVFSFFIVLISGYYLLKDGEKVKKTLLALSPLGDEQDDQVFRRIVSAVRAVVVGTLIVGVIKGVLAGTIFWILGVPAPLFWGTMTGFASFLPMVGSSLVTVPAALYMLIIGNVTGAIILAVVAVGIIGTIDNILQPKLVESKTNLHPLLVLLSILGGLSFYGFAGFILGPLTLAVTMALLEIYEKDFRPGSRATGFDGSVKTDGN